MGAGFVGNIGVDGGCMRQRARVCMSQDRDLSRRDVLKVAGGMLLGAGGLLQGGVPSVQAVSLKRLKLGPPVELEDGIVINEIKQGEGYSPSFGDTVTIHYSLFYDGIEVETSRDSQGLAARPLGFTWGASRGPGSILTGVPKGMEGMKVGGQRFITVPPQYAFGEKGKPPLIPPNATVNFAVSLLSVKRVGTNPNVSSRNNSVY